MFNVDILRIESQDDLRIGMPAQLVRRYVHGIDTPVRDDEVTAGIRAHGFGNKLHFLATDQSLAVIKDWPHYAVAGLAAQHGCSLIADKDDFFCLPLPEGDRAIDLGDSPDRSIFAYIFPHGRVDVVSAKSLMKHRYAVPMDHMEGAFEVTLVERRQAPASMIDTIRSVQSVFDARVELRHLFWSDFVPMLEDPFVLAQRIFLCDHVDTRPFAQAAAEVSFARGSATELAAVVRAAASLNLRRADRAHWTWDLMSWPQVITMHASRGRIGAVRGGHFTDAFFDVIDLLLAIMRPRATQMTSMPDTFRLSQAGEAPAPLHVAIPEDLLDPTAHDVIAHMAVIERTLVKMGISPTRAAEIIDEL